MVETMVQTIPESRQKLFTELYKTAFPAVARFVRNRGGSIDEAKDVFQDALIIFYEKTMESSASIHTSRKAYVLGTAQHLWIKKYKSDMNKVPLDILDESAFGDAEEIKTPLTGKITLFLETTGRKCLDLLQTFYYNKMGMEEIAGQFGFTSVRSATVQKYKCLEKLRDKVKEKSVRYEDFIGRD